MREVIVYLVNHKPGGCDGLDMSDKGGLTAVFWDRPAAEGFVKRDTRYKIVPTVIDVDEAQNEAVGKLDALDKLVLGISRSDVTGKLRFTDPNMGHDKD